MIISGKAMWAKVVGEAQPGYDKKKTEWSIDLIVTPEIKKQLAKEGIGQKVKLSKDGEYEYISFKRNGVRSDGTESKPIRIVDAQKKPWDGVTKIGNGSDVNISYLVNEVPYQGKMFKKPGILAIQVVNLVPYGGRDDEFETYETPTDANGEEDWSAE